MIPMKAKSGRPPLPVDPEKTKNRLRQLREARGMTQAELAAATGIPQPNISAYEVNGTKIKGTGEIRLAEFFDVDVRVLRGTKNVEKI